MRPTEEVAHHAVINTTAAWNSLQSSFVDKAPRSGRWRIRRGIGPQSAALWPVTQVVHASILGAEVAATDIVDMDRAFEALEQFRDHETYRDRRQHVLALRRGRVYYDDNAWIGLCAVQAALYTGTAERLDVAQRALRVVRSGEHPDGGVLWREGATSRHACSTSPAAVLALRMAELVPERRDDATAFAQRCLDFTHDILMDPNGLVCDNVNAHGGVETTLWSYNQGATIAANVLMHAATGSTEAQQRATDLAEATLTHYEAGDSDVLWHEPPAFVAILLRSLMLYGAATEDPRMPTFANAYARRLMARGRQGLTGLFVCDDIGHYERDLVLDQAGAVQALALPALDEQAALLLC